MVFQYIHFSQIYQILIKKFILPFHFSGRTYYIKIFVHRSCVGKRFLFFQLLHASIISISAARYILLEYLDLITKLSSASLSSCFLFESKPPARTANPT